MYSSFILPETVICVLLVGGIARMYQSIIVVWETWLLQCMPVRLTGVLHGLGELMCEAPCVLNGFVALLANATSEPMAPSTYEAGSF